MNSVLCKRIERSELLKLSLWVVLIIFLSSCGKNDEDVDEMEVEPLEILIHEIRTLCNAEVVIGINSNRIMALGPRLRLSGSYENNQPTDKDAISSNYSFSDELGYTRTFDLNSSDRPYFVRVFFKNGEDNIVYSNTLSIEFNFINDKTTKFQIVKEGYGEASLFQIQNKTYIAGGYIRDGSRILSNERSLFEYYPNESSLQLLNPLPFYFMSGFSFSYNGEGYLGGGQEQFIIEKEVYSNKLYRYKESTDTWLELSSIPTDSLECGIPIGLAGCFSFVLGDNGYVGCGNINSRLDQDRIRSRDIWKYDFKKDQWDAMNDFPIAHAKSAAFVLDGTAFVGSGLDDVHDIVNNLWEFDEVMDKWIEKSPMPLATCDAVGLAHKGYGYIIGGDGTESTIQRYDPRSDSWDLFCTDASINEGVGFIYGDRMFAGFGNSHKENLKGLVKSILLCKSSLRTITRYLILYNLRS